MAWHASGCYIVKSVSATAGSPRIPVMSTVPLTHPGLSEQEPPNHPLLNPLLSGQGTDA